MESKMSWLVKSAIFVAITLMCCALAMGQVKTDSGLIEGTTGSDGSIQVFKGIPYAAPPVGDLRWQEPHPVTPWQGVKKADAFGPRCMQLPIYSDMIFRDEMSEDCLYLNVWTPAKSPKEHLPVMVWIYGGGFQAGSASEPRQDGEHLAKKGVIVVSMNYRLGVFGFLAHPDLSKESSHHASGNYALMDQAAALRWVRRNIAAFGGDPKKVTIFGESAGSFSVSAQMASPVAAGLFQRAIGESGAFFAVAGQPGLGERSLHDAEQAGEKFAAAMNAKTIAELRAKPATEVLHAARSGFFGPNIDGYFLPASVYSIYAAGKQSHVPLLAGWNADEVRGSVTLAKVKPTVESFSTQARSRFGDSAGALLKVYPAASDSEALESAASLAGDLFIGYSTWKWIEMQCATGNSPVYRYSFDRARPIVETTANGITITSKDIGARHAAEIEYVFGDLDSSKDPWKPEDRKLSEDMMTYWSNFAKTGDPNGPGLAKWPRYDAKTGYEVLHLNTYDHTLPDSHRARYEFLDAFTDKARSQREQ